jgi:HK97 family phage portal protein
MPHLELYRRPQLTRWDYLRQFVRSITLGPYNPKDREIARLFGGMPASSGVSLNETTAMTYSAVWAAVNLIAGAIASVPLNLYKREGQGKVLFSGHPLHRMLHERPNPQMGSAIFRRTLQAHKLIWGNGYAEIERDQLGRPVYLWPLLPFTVQPYLERGILRYRVYNQDGPPIDFDSADILHLRGYSDDGICGVSTITKARESLGLGVAAERFGSTFFGNGSSFGGIISYPPGIGSNPQTRKENRESIERVHQGPDRAHRFLALYEGAKYERLGIPPNDAQFLETREFQIEEVCRWFNVPPHKLKHLKRATFSNIEQQAIEYVTDSLNPHWIEWEEELTMKLVAPLERQQQVIEFNREGMLQGDSAARGEFFSKQFSIGAITQNEIRAKDNLNPLKPELQGDIPYVPSNMMPADLARQYWQAQIDAATAKAEAFTAKSESTSPVAPPPSLDEQKAWHDALDLSRSLTQKAEDLQAKAEADLTAERLAHDVTREELTKANADVLRSTQEEQAQRAIRQEAETLAMRATAERDALTARCDLIEKDYQRVCGELTVVQTAAQTEQQTIRADVDGLRRELSTREAERDAALHLADQHARDLAVANMAATDWEALCQEARTQTGQAENDKGAALLKVQTLDQLLAASALEVESLKTDVARARSDIASELERAQTNKAVLLAAMRSLFIDATERLIERESNRARHHMATIPKFTDWIGRFYPLHVSAVRDAFRPIVGPWTAITGGSPNILLDRLVAEHVRQSEQAMRLVAEADDPDEFAASLERTLSRWHEERADAMADALVREGMES